MLLTACFAMIMSNCVLTSTLTLWDALLLLLYHSGKQCFQHAADSAVVDDYFLSSALLLKGAENNLLTLQFTEQMIL